jgi:hypothetical protein
MHLNTSISQGLKETLLRLGTSAFATPGDVLVSLSTKI